MGSDLALAPAIEGVVERDPDERRYWATLDGNDLGAAVRARCDGFYSHPLVRQILGRQARGWGFYYGYGDDWFHGTSGVGRFGHKGGLATMRVNTSRRSCVAWWSSIVARQPVWNPIVGKWNSGGVRSLKAAKQLLEDAWSHQLVARKMTLATEAAAYTGESFIMGRWNPLAGRVINTDGQRVVHAGATTYSNHSGWTVVRNPTLSHWDDRKWVIVVDRENKYDLAADPSLTAEQRQRVLDSSSSGVTQQWFWIGLLAQPGQWEDDDIPVLRLYHEPTAAVPYGRQANFLTDGTMYGRSGPLKGEMIPVARVSPGEMDCTPFGYTGFHDALAAQSIIDHLHSAAATNYGAFARQVVAMKKGESAANIQRLTDLSILWYDEVKPEGVNLTAMAQGWLQYLAELTSEVQGSMGQSDVSLGKSPGDRAPASLGALLAATTAQGATGFAQSYEDALKRIGRITIIQNCENATEPINVTLVGAQAGRDGMSEISAEDLKGVEYVDVDLGSAMQNSPGTRVQVAEMLAAVPDPKHRAELIEIINTDRYEPISENIEAQYARTMDENEQIARGIIPDVNAADDDLFHGRQHQLTFMDGPARLDKNAMRADNVHMGLHYVQEYGTVTTVRPDLKNPWAPVNDQFLADIEADPMYPLHMRRLRGKPPPLEMQQAQATAGALPGAPTGPGDAPGGSPEKPAGASPTDPAKMPPLPPNAATGLSSNGPDRGGVPAPP